MRGRFDIETSGSDWGSHSANHAWLAEGVAKAESILGRGRVGIYTSANSWSVVMGNVKAFGDLPVWYAHYDGRASFSDFERFGAWSKPAMKVRPQAQQSRTQISVLAACGTGAHSLASVLSHFFLKQFNDAPEVCGASIDHNYEA